MTFTTLKYIVFFLIVLIFYYKVPKKMQWGVLLIASYIFYAFASPKYLIVLGIVTLVSYGCAYKIGNVVDTGRLYLATNNATLAREDKKKYKLNLESKKKLWVVVCIAAELLILIAFKYMDFFFGGIVFLPSDLRDSFRTIILPIGLSFYMFQSMGYCIDVYREVYKPEKNFAKYALFVSFFPQLLQGPIGDFNKLEDQLLAQRDFDYDAVKYGLQRATWGFFKKLVIANQISAAIADVWTDYESYAGITIFVTLALYAIQLYADFSGYMDIAIGCAQSLGIELDENFKTPYFSKNIAQYWRHWHITLGVWFKKYLFYPLLLTKPLTQIRKTYIKKNPYVSNTVPTAIALVITWVLTGLWHGANWNFVLYGVYYGLFITFGTLLEPLYSKFHEKHKKLCASTPWALFQMLRTFLIVTIGYAIFVPSQVSTTAGMISALFAGLGTRKFLGFCYSNILELFIAFVGTVILFLVDIVHYRKPNISIRNVIGSETGIVRWSIYVFAILSILMLGAYSSADASQFAYFRF